MHFPWPPPTLKSFVHVGRLHESLFPPVEPSSNRDSSSSSSPILAHRRCCCCCMHNQAEELRPHAFMHARESAVVSSLFLLTLWFLFTPLAKLAPDSLILVNSCKYSLATQRKICLAIAVVKLYCVLVQQEQ